MSIRTLDSVDLDGFTAQLVEVDDERGGITRDWELACDECDYFATHLTQADVDSEVAAHEHVWSVSEIEAVAIISDHAAGWHADHDDPRSGCEYPRCEEAFWILTAHDDDVSP